jgi:hypothetical protein
MGRVFSEYHMDGNLQLNRVHEIGREKRTMKQGNVSQFRISSEDNWGN